MAAATVWLQSAPVAALAEPLRERVFSQADGNLGNFMWDGEQCRVVDFEDSGVSDPAYEVADLVEHVTVWLPGLVNADELVSLLEFSPEQNVRVAHFRRLFAVYWLLILPGNSGAGRNPEGSLERQADRVLSLL